jgi:hypothetical protein
MLLIYAHSISSRLKYITKFLFHDLAKMECPITTDVAEFLAYQGIKINYSPQKIAEREIRITPHGLLAETEVKPQNISMIEVDGQKAFFQTENGDLPFDIFAASFYLLSRYEEYLPHKKDIYGRYAHENSLAFKENFLHLPLINIWAMQLNELVRKKFPGFTVHQPTFRFLPTYDIDIAYSFKYKGLFRTIGGAIRSPSPTRWKVLSFLARDPYDAYDWMDALHKKYHLSPIYFFLVAATNSVYDKNILPTKKGMRNLITAHAARYQVGIHPSWRSGDRPRLLPREILRLEHISGTTINHSRQHYIRFNLPTTYQRLIKAGITDDYSMGYGSINGFRASVASSFSWFNLQTNEATALCIHPFCFMEANAYYEQKESPALAYEEMLFYYKTCKMVGGRLITVWHNHFLGTEPKLKGWRDIYEKFITEVAGR